MFAKTSHRQVFLVEILQRITSDNEITLKFSSMPLARALDMTSKGQLDAVLAITPQHLAEFNLQPSQLSFGGLYHDFYVLSHSKWQFSTINDLDDSLKDNKILGVINGYEYGRQLN